MKSAGGTRDTPEQLGLGLVKPVPSEVPVEVGVGPEGGAGAAVVEAVVIPWIITAG